MCAYTPLGGLFIDDNHVCAYLHASWRPRLQQSSAYYILYNARTHMYTAPCLHHMFAFQIEFSPGNSLWKLRSLMRQMNKNKLKQKVACTNMRVGNLRRGELTKGGRCCWYAGGAGVAPGKAGPVGQDKDRALWITPCLPTRHSLTGTQISLNVLNLYLDLMLQYFHLVF